MAQLFDLHVLGWKAFEDLVGCIFRDILGQTVQIFAEGADGGRDAAFRGIWSGTSAQVGLSPHYQERCHPSYSQTRGLDGAEQCVVTARRSRLMSEGG